jgi:hypothetical protein
VSNNNHGLSKRSSAVSEYLASHPVLLNVWAIGAAFGTYFSMYMFRKPFTSASFSQSLWEGWDQKSVLVASQIIGYLISKMIGIRVISEIHATKRAGLILILIGCAHLSLFLFALVPSPWHVVCIFVNGLPLGMVFGLVLGFLEGRRVTELLTAGLCSSFILAGGVSKTIGQWTLQWTQSNWEWSLETAERWMPFLSGLLFVVPMSVCVWMLAQVPAPSRADQDARSERTPMSRTDRRSILWKYATGLTCISIVYFLVTILRSLRDDFAPEILLGLGAKVKPSEYATIDFYVAATALVVNASAIAIRDNRNAMAYALSVCASGFVLIAASLLMQTRDWITPQFFMVLVGAGLYLPYVAIHTTVFERMVAITRDRANIGFLMYLVDTMGYFGYAGIMVIRNVSSDSLRSTNGGTVLDWFLTACWMSAIVGVSMMTYCIVYFFKAGKRVHNIHRNSPQSSPAP